MSGQNNGFSLIFLRILAPLVAGLSTFYLLNKHISVNSTQQIIAILLLIILIFSNKFSSLSSKKIIGEILNQIFIFIICLFALLLVISSGGLNSPLLIIIHLIGLGLSIFVAISTGAAFTISAILILVINLSLNTVAKMSFLNDLGTGLLYLSSLLIVIPLSFLLARFYHLKESLLEITTKAFNLSSSRQKSLLSGVNDLVLVTDQNLNIITVSEAVEKIFHLAQEELKGQTLLKSIKLKDAEGQAADRDTLSVDAVISDKVTHIVKGFSLFIGDEPMGKQVTIQINPILEAGGKIEQLVFIIKEPGPKEKFENHQNLEQAIKINKARLENIRKALVVARENALKEQLDLFNKTEEDILLALEIEDHPTKGVTGSPDVAFLSKQILERKKQFAVSLGVALEFVLPAKEGHSESALMDLYKSGANKVNLPLSLFTVSIDEKLLALLVEKLLDLAILFIAGQRKDAKVQLIIRRSEDNIEIRIAVNNPRPLTTKEYSDLLTEYYGDLASKTNLKLGSGLEGFIAKQIASELKIPLLVQSNPESQGIVIRVYLSKT